MATVADSTRDNLQPICKNCLTSTTPLWRRDEIGSVLCNACGLYLKLHDRPRPISLKTDVIKSRNRVKSSGQAPKKKSLFENDGLTPVRADASNPDHVTPDYRRASQKSTGAASDGSNSPLSRTGTPSLLNNHNGSNNITNGNGSSNHNHNIAPQSMFDNASLHEHSYTPSAAFPAIQLNQPSPGSSSSVPDRHLEPPQTYEGLMAANTALKTRVSELEVINDLFRGRVAELEQSEASARRAEAARAESEDYIKKALNDTQARESALKRRLDDLEKELEEVRHLERSPKRMRVSDMVAQSAISKPQTATA